jgi:large subunit ribosomal protein L10
MKTKSQKQDDLKTSEQLLDKSNALVFIDFSGVRTADLRNLRRELKQGGNPLFIVKKRLLTLMLKKRGIEFDDRQFKTSVGTVFASNLESATASVYKFFRGLELEKKADTKKILGGYNVTENAFVDRARVIFIGQLPPREVLLAQLLGMIAAPIRSFLYILQQKSQRSST